MCLTEAFEEYKREEDKQEILDQLTEAKETLAKAPLEINSNWKLESILSICLFNLVTVGVIAALWIF